MSLWRMIWTVSICFIPALVTGVAVACVAGSPSLAPLAVIAATVSCAVVAGFVCAGEREACGDRRQDEVHLRNGLRRAEGEISRLERMAMLGEALVAVAHDINNPLTAILGFCEMALDSPSLDREARGHLEVVQSQAERCRRLVHALLPFSRKSHGRAEPTQLNDLVASVLQLREFSFRSAGIRTQTVLSPSTPVVRVPAAEAQLAILNLVVNAEQALAEVEGERFLSVSTRTEGDRAVVVVEDSGPGVAREDRERIFESFYTTKPVGVGTGIGLTNARRVAERWGGSLVYRPASPSGAQFELAWPCMLDAPEARTTEPNPDVDGLTVVAVDDEWFMLNFYQETLSRHGCRVRVFSRAADALAALRHEIPDVLLMDWVRPEEVTPLALERLFEEMPELQQRTVLVTGEPTPPDATSGLTVILKPFGQHDLLQAVQRAAAAGRDNDRADDTPRDPAVLKA